MFYLKMVILAKLGGAAITIKSQLETFNHGLDLVNPILPVVHNTILVHGAGSFGHQFAKEFKLAEGGQNGKSLCFGIAKTRSSVRKLNTMIVDKFVEQGIPAIGISPGDHLLANNSQFNMDLCQSFRKHLYDLVNLGYLPIVHGDVVIDDGLGCCIISGDKLIEILLSDQTEKVCFLTNVNGLLSEFDSETGNGNLIPILRAQEFSIDSFNFSMNGEDVTGGMRGKVECCLRVASRGFPVYIVKAGTPSAAAALCGSFDHEKHLGTLIIQ
jgi:isopentenyl phosphate kinase